MEAAAKVYKDVAQSAWRDQLILDHLTYVRHIVRKMIGQLPDGIDEENLEAAGMLGLVEAAQQYDPGRDVVFKTYAFPRIRGAILDELRRNSPIPQKLAKQISQVREVCQQLRPPITPEAIAEKTSLSLEEVERCLEAMRLTRFGLTDGTPVALENIGDHRTDQPATAAETAESKRLLADAIEQLPEQERVVVTLYYLEDLRLKEVGEVINLSESRVSRILAKAEFRLQQYVRSRE
jgi:RNA polymerase sigma factor for flagellar operon FliA